MKPSETTEMKWSYISKQLKMFSGSVGREKIVN